MIEWFHGSTHPIDIDGLIMFSTSISGWLVGLWYMIRTWWK